MTHDDRLIDVDGVRRWAGPGVLVVFVGVATGGSRSHDAFPAWAATLGRTDWTLRGLDLPPTAPASAYVELVEAIAANRASPGPSSPATSCACTVLPRGCSAAPTP